MVVILWKLDFQLPVQSVPITTKVVSLNPVHGEVYSIQHYVIKFVSYLRQDSGFLRVPRFPDCHDITKILLKVELNTMNRTEHILGYYYNMIPFFYSELSAVKEHDKKVTKEAKKAQEDVRCL